MTNQFISFRSSRLTERLEEYRIGEESSSVTAKRMLTEYLDQLEGSKTEHKVLEDIELTVGLIAEKLGVKTSGELQ